MGDRARGRPRATTDDDTRSILIAAASRQFQANGYTSASISAIAEEAGVSTKTLYRLFPTKSDLFHDVVSRRIFRFVAELEGVFRFAAT